MPKFYLSSNLFIIILIIIISFFSVSDLLLNPYQPSTFDEPVHLITISQFHQALKSGDFPVFWTNNFANYGYPLGLIAHPLTSYLGAFIDVFTNNPLYSYNLLILLSSILSAILFYYFLRFYFTKKISLISTIFFSLSAYKIINIYIRGALPEFFSLTPFLLSLVSLNLVFLKHQKKHLFLFILSLFLILISHPMIALLYLPIIFLYFISISTNLKKDLALFFSSSILALLVSSFYLIPLKLEIKYLTIANLSNSITDQFLGFDNYFSPNWFYFLSHPGPRGYFIKFGLIETIIIILSIFFYLNLKDKTNKKLFLFCLISSTILIILTLPFSRFIYSIPLLTDIQFPWRSLSPLSIFPPIFLAFIFSQFKKDRLIYIFLIILCLVRFPQLYTKNNINFDSTRYLFTKENLHTNNLNTVWMGQANTYPIKEKQFEIIEGEGSITSSFSNNSTRYLEINAQTPIRVIDYTFYFPGWNLYINGVKTDFEYQDPNYRGIITYRVPEGKSHIELMFQDTKIRKYSKYLSLLSFSLSIIYCYFYPRIKN